MTETSRIDRNLVPMTSDVAVRPEAGRLQLFLETLDDVATTVEEARAALAENNWNDKRAIDDLSRAILSLVGALEQWVGSARASRDEPESDVE